MQNKNTLLRNVMKCPGKKCEGKINSEFAIGRGIIRIARKCSSCGWSQVADISKADWQAHRERVRKGGRELQGERQIAL